jgi:hypothetical protein
MNNSKPKPIDEILLVIQSIHTQIQELKNEINELKLIVNDMNASDTTYRRGWFWN